MSSGQLMFTLIFLVAVSVLIVASIAYVIFDKLFWDTLDKKEALDTLRYRKLTTDVEMENESLTARGEYHRKLILSDGPEKRETLIVDQYLLPSIGSISAMSSGERVPGALATHFSPSNRFSYNNHAQNSLKEGENSIEVEKIPEMPKISLLPLLAGGYEDLNKRDLSLMLGKSAEGEIITAKTESLMIAAICGNTGGGKSVLLKSLLIQWYLHYTEGAPINFAMIDMTKKELNIWKPANNFLKLPFINEVKVKALADNPSDAEKLLSALVTLMEERSALPEEERTKLPWLIIAIEELIDTRILLSKAARSNLDTIVRLGRSSNFRIVWTAQYVRGSDIDKSLASQIHSIFVSSLRQGTQGVATATALGFDFDEVPKQQGAFAYDLAMLGKRGVLQVPLISDKEVQTILQENKPKVESQEEAVVRVYKSGITTIREIAEVLTLEDHDFPTTKSPIGEVVKDLRKKGLL